jgi:hypothetical protein
MKYPQENGFLHPLHKVSPSTHFTIETCHDTIEKDLFMIDTISFSTQFPLTFLIRPLGQTEWQVFGFGPGYFHIPTDTEVGIKIKPIQDAELASLSNELSSLAPLRMLDLAENRNITDEGIQHLKKLTQLTELNLSSCSIHNIAIESLASLPRLQRLNLSYCNRLNDGAIKPLQRLDRLTYLDLLGCLKITQAGFSKLRRNGLEIHK